MEKENLKEIQKFRETRDRYYLNALEMIDRKEYRKASELLWGSITQGIKLLAGLRNIRIATHRQFFGFLKELSKELGDEEIYETFLFLRDLHENFYDEVINPEDFDLYLKKATEFNKKLEEIGRKIEAGEEIFEK